MAPSTFFQLLDILIIYLFLFREHGNSRQVQVQGLSHVPKNSLKVSAAKDFLRKISKEQGQHQPDKKETHLPQGMTKLDVYEKYIQDLPAFGSNRFKVSEPYWYSIWRRHFKWLKCPKICKFSECKICSTAKLHKQVAPAEMRGM